MTSSKTKMNLMRLLLVALVFLSFAASVHAIGISPARKYISYEEGQTYSVKLRILNDGSPTRISLYAQGPLAPYVTFTNSLLVFQEGDQASEVTYTVRIPPGLEPGTHEADIVALELPDVNVQEGKDTAVVATTAVASKLQVQIPYPGKFIRGKVLVSEALAQESVAFKIPVYNFGEIKADQVYARVEILGPTNEILGEVLTDTIAVAPKEEATLYASWIANVYAGRYLARVTLYFDGEKIQFEEAFNVGDQLVRIRDITSDDFKLGDIAKFNILVESIWNKPLGDLFLDVDVIDSRGVKIDSFKSTTTSLNPNEEKMLTAFWDTSRATEGRYDLRFILNYGGKTTEKILQVLLTLNGIETDLVGTGKAVSPDVGLIQRDSLLVILVFILIFLNVFILYKFVIKKGNN